MSDQRDWAYELWVHLSAHVNQRCELDEPDDCEHCRNAGVDCDECFRLLKDWEASLDEDGRESLPPPNPTHQKMRAALEQIVRSVHPSDRMSSCAGLPYCHGCIAATALGIGK